jgi:hypothetical protein
MTTTIIYADDVPPPAGAVHVAPWEHDQPMAPRPFFGAPRGISGRAVVVGHQWVDGSVESVATVEIIGHLEGLTCGQAREVASALLQVAPAGRAAGDVR